MSEDDLNADPPIIDIQDEINAVSDELSQLILKARALSQAAKNVKGQLSERNLQKSLLHSDDAQEFEKHFESLNFEIDKLLITSSINRFGKHNKFPKLSMQDTLVASLSGLLSVLIDIVFVGTPEVVKLYRGGENFDGSMLTSALRKIGNGNGTLSPILEWISDKCKVPYDISLQNGIVTPNNHRLRSFSHDPLFGLLFAIADIILGTTTCIDDDGHLRILLNHRKIPTVQKWLSIIYYFGHLISDVCTARGLPIPGFFMTQFFTSGIDDSSIASVAESMYKDGYDLRHMISMSTPVFVKDILIKVYIHFTREDIPVIDSMANKEKKELDESLKTYKMKFIANSIATIGNAVKFVAPPNCGNPCAINLIQWIAFLNNGVVMIRASTRDFSLENVMYRRDEISEKWKELLFD